MKESQTTEWKRSWRDEYLKWICGFANTDGGVLVIGREDDGLDVGVANVEKLLEDIPNKVRDLLGIVVDVNLLEKGGKDLVVINVDAHPYPISYKGQYHLRSGSTKQELKGTALDNFLLKKQGRHWDGVPVPHVLVEDLSATAVDNFKSRASKGRRLSREDIELERVELLEKLHLMENGYLKRAGILLFHPEPARFITGAVVKIGYFRGDSDLVFQDEISGDLFSVVERTMDLLITKYLKAEIGYVGIQREEKLPVAEEALREAILNAVAHKDYVSNAPIQISVYIDRLMIWNNGVLKDGWTVETLKRKHPSQPFNPDIAHVLFLAGMIESWGRGIEKMISACKKHQCGGPHLKYEDVGFWVEFTWSASNAKIIYASNALDMLGLDKPLTLNQQKILYVMNQNPAVSVAELASQLEVSERTIERNLNFFREKRLLSRVGNSQGGAWLPIVVVHNVGKHVGGNVGKDVAKLMDVSSLENDEMRKIMGAYSLSENEALVLLAIGGDSSLTISRIASILGVQVRTVERYLQKLRGSGLIYRIGSRRSGEWKLDDSLIDVGINVGDVGDEKTSS